MLRRSTNTRKPTDWGIEQLKRAAKASRNMRLDVHGTVSGSFLWHTAHPWPQRPPGLVEKGFKELAKRRLPILDTFDEHGVDVVMNCIQELITTPVGR